MTIDVASSARLEMNGVPGTSVMSTLLVSNVVVTPLADWNRLSSNLAGPGVSVPVPPFADDATAAKLIVQGPGGSTPVLDPHVTCTPPAARRVVPCTIVPCSATP